MSESAKMSAYQYSPLDSSNQEIRLLELPPGKFDSELKGILHTVRLSDNPDYEALSYTWGSQDDRQTMILDEHDSLQITQNLFRALQRLRYRWKKRILWVDAICINQSDTVERGAQVAFMGTIYATARSCAIWLGDVEKTNSRHLGSRLRAACKYCVRRFPHKRKRWTAMWFLASSKMPAMDYALRTTNPPWHTRAWVQQEICLCRSYSLHFGSKRMRGYHERDSELYFHLPNLDDDSCEVKLQTVKGFYAQLYQTVEIKGKAKGTATLLDVIYMSFECSVSDPRDKIYSMLDLISAREKEIIGSSYGISPACVFAKATFASMHSGDRFYVLSWVKPTDNGVDFLPTWTLNFQSHRSFPLSERAKDGSTRDPDISLSEDRRCLVVAGVPLDSVLAVLPFRMEGLDFPESTDSPMRQKLEGLAKSHAFMLVDAGCTEVDIASSHTATQLTVNTLLHKEDGRSGSGAGLHNIFDAWNALTSEEYRVSRSSTPDLSHALYVNGSETTGPAFFTTPSGYIGLTRNTCQAGDRLAVPLLTERKEDEDLLVGSYWEQPTLVLRPQGSQWTFRGLAFMYDRDNLPMRKAEQREFMIC